MQLVKAVLAGAILLSMALSGCSGIGGGGDSGGFSISGSDGTYKFTASGSADNYTWDLGDHLTRAYTKSVEHTYDFTNGVIPVVLTVTHGEKKTEHRKSITLGTGTNSNAGFVLEGSQNWTIPGETVTFSAHRSSDPDGDPLRYTWSCQRVSDAVRQSAHSHPGFSVPFATPSAGSIISINAQAPLPTADRTVTGDLCEGLGQGGHPSLDTTITGAFTKTGIYDIYLLASDPMHPTTSGKYRIVATNPSERPVEKSALSFDGKFVVGYQGTVQSVCTNAQQCGENAYDQASHPFTLGLAAQRANMSLAYTDTTGQMKINCQLNRGSTPLESTEGPGSEVDPIDPANLKQGSYTIVCKPMGPVTPTSPEGVAYTVTFQYDLDMDPFKVY